MSKLTEEHFSFKCPMRWDEMEVAGDQRHCSKCRKRVYDLTDCSIDEVIALQRKHGSICGSIRVAKVAVAAISISAAACQNTPGPRMLGTPTALKSDVTKVDGIPVFHPSDYHPGLLRSGEQAIDRNTIDGVICSPEFLDKHREQ